jgi:hypothetical protein
MFTQFNQQSKPHSFLRITEVFHSRECKHPTKPRANLWQSIASPSACLERWCSGPAGRSRVRRFRYSCWRRAQAQARARACGKEGVGDRSRVEGRCNSNSPLVYLGTPYAFTQQKKESAAVRNVRRIAGSVERAYNALRIAQ